MYIARLLVEGINFFFCLRLQKELYNGIAFSGAVLKTHKFLFSKAV